MTRTKNIVRCEICQKEFHASGLNGHLYNKHGIRKSKVPKDKMAPSEPPKIEVTRAPDNPNQVVAPTQEPVQSLEDLFKEEINSSTPASTLIPDHPAFRPSGPDGLPSGPVSTVVGPEFPGGGGGFQIVGWGSLYSLMAEILNSIGGQLHEKEPKMPWMPIPMNQNIARQLGDQTSAVMGPVDAKKALAGSILLCFGPAALCILAMLLGPRTFSKFQEKFSKFVDKSIDKVGGNRGQPDSTTG